MNIYALTNRSVEIERIAEEFFKDEIIHKATKQPAKHFDINLVENTPLFTPPCGKRKKAKKSQHCKGGRPSADNIDTFRQILLGDT